LLGVVLAQVGREGLAALAVALQQRLEHLVRVRVRVRVRRTRVRRTRVRVRVRVRVRGSSGASTVSL